MPYTYPVSVVVGTAGATIDCEDGFTLVIRENALSGNTTITIAAPVTAPDVSTLDEVSRAYAIGPLGTQLAVDAVYFVPYFTGSEPDRLNIEVFVGDVVSSNDPTGWTPTPQDLSVAGSMGGTVSVLRNAMAAIVR